MRRPPAPSSGLGWCPSSSLKRHSPRPNLASPAPEGSSMETKTSLLGDIARGAVSPAAAERRRGGGSKVEWEESGSFRGPGRETAQPRPRVTVLYITAAACVTVAYASPDRIRVIRSFVFHPFVLDGRRNEPVNGRPAPPRPPRSAGTPGPPACRSPQPAAAAAAAAVSFCFRLSDKAAAGPARW